MKKIIKFLALPIAFLAFLVSKGAEPASGTEQHSKKLTLIGEAHSSPEGMKLCYNTMRDKSAATKINFFIERDAERIQWATAESGLLVDNSEGEFLANHLRKHLPSLEAHSNELAGRIYGNIFAAPRTMQPGLIKNRFWFLKILKYFSTNPNINIVPIDASFADVIRHPTFTSKSDEFDEKFAADLNEATETGNQACIDIVMRSNWALVPRDSIMTHKLEEQTEVGSINIALLGLVHAAEIYGYLDTLFEILPSITSIPKGELAKEQGNARVQGFLRSADLIN